jgi:phenylalanyl-tRNA synthetase beta chain
VFDALEIAEARTEPATPPGFDPARAGAVVVDGEGIGVVGEIDREVLEALDLAPPVIALEVDLGRLLQARRRDRTFRPPSPYPPSTIDLAFVVDEDIPAGDVAATLRAAAGDVLEDVRLFDVFRSDTLGAGHKSLAFALRFRAPDHTLTDDEVGEIRGRCIDAVVRAHGAELRG